MKQGIPSDEEHRGAGGTRPPEERGRGGAQNRLRGSNGTWTRLLLLSLLVVGSAVLMSRSCGSASELAGRAIPYSVFRDEVQRDNVKAVTFQGEVLAGELRRPVTVSSGRETERIKAFTTVVPPVGDEELLGLLEQHGVVVQAERSSSQAWTMGLIYLVPLALFFVISVAVFMRMRRQGQQLLSIGSSRAKLYQRTDERTLFDDVAGLEGAKGELREIIEFLRDPSRYWKLGGQPPKGVLLVGPPGTGKTLLARATAGEAGVPFFSITGSDFMEMFVGVGASRVRDLFREARAAAPSIIFIDELDSIGRRRGAGLGGGHDEREQTLNQLLGELDGFEPHEGVVVLAATNRPDILDPALLRPGRFDRHVVVDAPGVESRLQILRVHARNKPLAEDVNLEDVARSTPGFSGADLRNLLNEAALTAGRKGKDRIERADIEDARDKLMLGLRREGLALTKDECRVLAYHEAGHAVLAATLPHADPVRKVSITPRGRSMGATHTWPERDVYIYTGDYLLERLAVLMGGRVSERLILGTATSGAEQDLKEATRLARTMVLDWGMADRLGPVALGEEHEQIFLGRDIGQPRTYSEVTAREVDEEVRKLLMRAYQLADEVIASHRPLLDAIAQALMEREELSGDEIKILAGQHDGTGRDGGVDLERPSVH